MRSEETPKARMAMMTEIGESLSPLSPEDPAHLQQFVDLGFEQMPHMFRPIPGTNEEHFNHTLHMMHLAWRWAKEGRPAYQLTHSLASALMLTEPPKMAEGEELDLPNQAFVVILPPGLIPAFGPEGQTWADLIWVHRFRAWRDRSKKVEWFFRWLTESGPISVWRDRSPAALYDEDERVYVLNPGEKIEPQGEDDITMSGALRLLRNLCSWLSATGELEKLAQSEPPKKKRKKSKKDKGPRPHVLQIGRSVKLATELRQMATEISLGTSRHAREGWQLRTRHIVVGHWKMQAYGEGRKLRKRIWVEPYWRGPEGEEAWAAVLDTPTL